MYLSKLTRTFTHYLKCIFFLFAFQFLSIRSIRNQELNNQTYIHLYTGSLIHNYIYGRSHSGYLLSIMMCLQITSNFSLCVHILLCPFPIISNPFVGLRFYTPILLLVMGLVAPESPIKMFFPRSERVLSLVT